MPRIVHERTAAAADITLCGFGSTAIADAPDEVTCKNCLRVRQRHADRQQEAALTRDARWNRLRAQLTCDIAIEQELGDDYADAGTDSSLKTAYKHWGKAEALREVLAWMDRAEGQS